MNGFRLPSKIDAILSMEHVDPKKSPKHTVKVSSQETVIPLNLVINCVDDQMKNHKIAQEKKTNFNNIEPPERAGD